ncbi:axonemal dynein light intermediate polypeptide 1-like isoform X2 [Argiope bruennichi]|uniref:Axonemal dynein light intermediate polypeptide like protein n=1 Tax=Argiope bruennichi TaxID=94029 RepID=A0A8T0G0D5_ARGBR|nr:axonemal dynein light intermediate polypeptide 1-like isoform X2 [Argiope bruennichi]KAF8794623.1 Axonemal dynein light intermediate polypeptide like protein [Argiope bruennichi]
MATSLSEMIAAPTLSLVKYETPTLVTTKDADTKGTRRESRLPNIRDNKPSSARSSRQETKSKDLQVAEILDAILPPREFEEDGKLWIQPVSRTPATRLDVINLAEKLDARLIERNAREIGICPIRRELYDQCFDELIRQETLNCMERGLLLVRIRDELRMSLAAYENLYDSGVSFGIRKALLSERGKMDIVERLDFLTAENEEMRKQLKLQEARHALMERDWEQQTAVESKKLGDKIELLERANSQLKMYPEYSYPWYSHSRTFAPLYSKDMYTRRALMSINAARARVRNILEYPSYRLPALRLSPETRINLYRKRARNLSLE